MMIMLWLALRPVSIPGMATPMSLGCTSLQRHVAQVAPTSYSMRSPNSRLRRQGKRLVLEVAESNIRAARSYRSYGFVETGQRRTLDRDPSITEIEFAYPLAGMRHA